MFNQDQVELDQIKAIVAGMAARISAPSSLLPTYGASVDMRRPHVEINARGYHVVVFEKGVEQYRTTVKFRDDLLFEIFRGVASSMGFEFEMRQAQRDIDPRRGAFDKALSILGMLNKDWEKWQKEHYDRFTMGTTGRRSPGAARRHPGVPSCARRRDGVLRRTARQHGRSQADSRAAERIGALARHGRQARRSTSGCPTARGDCAGVAQRDVPALAYERDRHAARAHHGERNGFAGTGRERVRSVADAASHAVRSDLRASTGGGAHGDAVAHRFRAREDRAVSGGREA